MRRKHVVAVLLRSKFASFFLFQALTVSPDKFFKGAGVVALGAIFQDATRGRGLFAYFLFPQLFVN
jgi:hypothetical protein